MRAAFWLLALFAIAAASALFAGNNQAVVSIFWPPHRIDVSFNLAVFLLVGLFVLIYVALRALSAVVSLPLEARRWRAQQKERAMYGALMDALAHQLAGRYIRATRSAKNALTQEKSLARLAKESGQVPGYSPLRASQLQSLANLLVAESAQALQNKTLRDEHLQLAMQSSAPRHASAEAIVSALILSNIPFESADRGLTTGIRAFSSSFSITPALTESILPTNP